MPDWWENKEKDREKRRAGLQTLKLKPIVDAKNNPVTEDAKIARIRFLTDIKDAKSCWVHGVLKQSRLGKRFNEDVYCFFMNDDVKCKWCSDGDFPKRKLYFWIYCFDILHIRQDQGKKWEKIEYMGDKYFSEPVNDIRLFVTGVGKSSSTEDKFIRAGKRFKTLCDRNYDWTREGLGLDTSYDLVYDTEASEELSEVKKARENLPSSLDDIINKMKPESENEARPDNKIDDAPEELVDEDLEDLF